MEEKQKRNEELKNNHNLKELKKEKKCHVAYMVENFYKILLMINYQ